MSEHDVERFNRWAAGYDRHFLQKLIFEPVQQTILEVAQSEVPNAKAILDVGCGTGRLLIAAEPRFPDARLEGVDAAVEMVKHAQGMLPAASHITFRQATAEKLPFPDGQFDLVFSTMTFHHWSDQGKGISEVARVLTPAGRWLLADFIATGFMRYIRRLFRLRRFPERRLLDPMLAAAGLRVLSQRRVPRIGAQVPVLAIGRPTLQTT
ncbi:MAG: class I SAM-dependent methyltransferase [Chloroflexi bacterium]|nr:MAG: class I SAM-dependent methyltransferase [Chloroflexota bacterium]